ncbi:MAG TPA: pyridoxal phosphate-dependent aminotransferase [Chitinophagaceae bacterium]|nr:pyridoxal phosphate-dependent aminotransferase [Chitinophagaceae bacterium]
MQYTRMPIEIESPESLGYNTIECNLAESSVRDVAFKDIGINLNNTILCYGDHIGNPALRALIAGEFNGITPADVLLTVGAAGALFIIHSSLLTKDDHLIVVRPNYATNIETPRAIGSEISFIDLKFEEGYILDVNAVIKAIQPNTKLISITTPHNPTGVQMPAATIKELYAICEATNCYLLADETYRNLSFTQPAPLAAALGPKAISVSSASKAYGIPGIRLGWLITQDEALQYLFLAAKEQVHICNSVVDEEICYQYLLKKDIYFAGIQQEVIYCFNMLQQWLDNHPCIEWVKPGGGVVCFPRFKKEINIDAEQFYSTLLHEHKTYIGPGHWFEQSKRNFRLGFGWETRDAFEKGLANIDKAITASLL